MRIAQVSPLYESLPPKLFGGTERVVLRVCSALVDLTLHRYPDKVGINVDRRTGPVEIIALQ